MQEKKTVVVTGASGGIGRVLLDRLWRDGYECVAVDKDGRVLALEKEGVEAICADLTSDDIFERLKAVLEGKQRIYGIVFASGIMLPGKVTETEEDDWEATLEINLTAVFRFTKWLLPYLMQNKPSHVIAVASHLGVVASYDLTAYSVSKAALIEFVKCVALDYGDAGVMANCVSPGFLKTKMLDRAMSRFAGNKKWMFATGGMPKQHIDVEDVANLISFLLTQNSMNGENVVMDAGYSVR